MHQRVDVGGRDEPESACRDDQQTGDDAAFIRSQPPARNATNAVLGDTLPSCTSALMWVAGMNQNPPAATISRPAMMPPLSDLNPRLETPRTRYWAIRCLHAPAR